MAIMMMRVTETDRKVPYMMGRASGGLSEPLSRAQSGVELVAFVLGAVVLPIGGEGVRESAR